MHAFTCSHYVCFEAELEQNPSNPNEITCSPHKIAEEPIVPHGNLLYKIFSPDFNYQGSYPNNTLCKYSFPECPQGYVQEIIWSDGDFKLEQPYVNTPYCLDYVQMFLLSFDLERGGATLDFFSTPDQILCGSQGIFHLEINTNVAIRVSLHWNNT